MTKMISTKLLGKLASNFGFTNMKCTAKRDRVRTPDTWITMATPLVIEVVFNGDVENTKAFLSALKFYDVEIKRMIYGVHKLTFIMEPTALTTSTLIPVSTDPITTG